MNTTTTHDFCGISSGAETTTDYSDFTKHQSVVGEIRDIGKQMNDSINKSGLGCRWWMLLKDTPYTKGGSNLGPARGVTKPYNTTVVTDTRNVAM